MSITMLFLVILLFSYILAELLYEQKIYGRFKISKLVQYNTRLCGYAVSQIKLKGRSSLIDPIVFFVLLHYICLLFVLVLTLISIFLWLGNL